MSKKTLSNILIKQFKTVNNFQICQSPDSWELAQLQAPFDILKMGENRRLIWLNKKTFAARGCHCSLLAHFIKYLKAYLPLEDAITGYC